MELIETLRKAGIIPVIVIEDAEQAVPLARALVKGGLPVLEVTFRTAAAADAIARIKRCACPPNCRRLGKKTPCAATGVCADCDSPDRICKVTVVFDRKPTGVACEVVLVDEDLGY